MPPAGFFSFGSFDGASEEGGLELLLDSGINGFILKNKALFKDLGEAFNTDVGHPNGSQIRVEGRETARCDVLYSKGRMCERELKQAFCLPTYNRNLISLKTLAEQGAWVSFGKEANFRTEDGNTLPLVCTVMVYTLFVFFLLCVTLDQECFQWNVSQTLHMEVEGARVSHPDWAAIQPKAEPWCSGTGHLDPTTSMMWRG